MPAFRCCGKRASSPHGCRSAGGAFATMTTKPSTPTEVFPAIYGELRRVARRYLGRERKNHTLQPTALVNEAWLRLHKDRGAHWQAMHVRHLRAGADPSGPGLYADVGLDYMITGAHSIGLRISPQ